MSVSVELYAKNEQGDLTVAQLRGYRTRPGSRARYDLRWEPFAAAWAPEATVFLPEADRPHLVSGRGAVLAYFRALLAEVRADSTAGPPTLQILPEVRDFRVLVTGRDVALVTFELGGGGAPGRRTLVWAWDPTAGHMAVVALARVAIDPRRAGRSNQTLELTGRPSRQSCQDGGRHDVFSRT